MKSFIRFVVGCVLGVVVGGKLGYEYVKSVVADNIGAITETVVNEGIASGSTQAMNHYQGRVEDYKDQIKQRVKEEIESYMKRKLDAVFD